jgi:hypothetical protein
MKGVLFAKTVNHDIRNPELSFDAFGEERMLGDHT